MRFSRVPVASFLVLLLAACSPASTSDAGVDASTGLDAGAGCNAGPAQGCPCDGSVLTVCGTDIDYVCSAGTWFGHAGLCAMLDAGMPCSDEHRFSCPSGHGVVCCYGQEQWFFDGPCGAPGLDGGLSCGTIPVAGCPCTLDAGTTGCDGAQRFECTLGVWQPTPYACGSLCASGP